MIAQFKNLNIAAEFIEAYDADDRAVQLLLSSGFVKKFPPCFRCNQEKCACDNKELLAPQVANWLSHALAWRAAAAGSGLSLVCEDDLEFSKDLHRRLSVLSSDTALQQALLSKKPVLVRLGWAEGEDHRFTGEAALHRSIVRMSNPCYAINKQCALELLSGFREIGTTSDIYVHRIMAERFEDFTLIPPIACDLSWSRGIFKSEIRPKQVRVEYLAAELQSARENKDEVRAASLIEKLNTERQRLIEAEFPGPDLKW